MKAHPLGKLVTVPLTNFDDLTGKDGVLTRRQRTNYHQHSVIAYDNFKRVIVDHSAEDIQKHD